MSARGSIISRARSCSSPTVQRQSRGSAAPRSTRRGGRRRERGYRSNTDLRRGGACPALSPPIQSCPRSYLWRAPQGGASPAPTTERDDPMKIKSVDAFHMAWSPSDTPQQYSAFVRVVTDDGTDGIGEASPMLGGAAALGVIARDMAPFLVGKDPLDHAVLLDR